MIYHRYMGYPTTVQLISRKKTEQWYVNFPAAVARALDFEKGEIVEWTIESRRELVLMRKPKPRKKRTTKKAKKS
jgi:antitoxin component of MazEF toxin-antitoxin module